MLRDKSVARSFLHSSCSMQEINLGSALINQHFMLRDKVVSLNGTKRNWKEKLKRGGGMGEGERMKRVFPDEQYPIAY